MRRMTHVVNTLSSMIHPKTITKLAAVCVIGRMAYCALDNDKADENLEKSLREAKSAPFDKGINYDELYASDKFFQRCRVALTRSQGTRNSVITSNESCSNAQDILMSSLKRDKIDLTKTKVSMAISKRNLFSTQTKQVFRATGLTVEEAIVATAVAKR